MNPAETKFLSHRTNLKVLQTTENVSDLFLEFTVLYFCGCRLETDWMSD